MFSDLDENGWIDPAAGGGEVVQIDHYYPFGMRMSGTSLALATAAVPNDYLYNGKEYQDELGLGWSDYGARMYDASVGRWNGVDALAELYQSKSSYHFVSNNPLRYVDVDGRWFWESKHIRQARKVRRNLQREGVSVDFKIWKENGKRVASVVGTGSGPEIYGGMFREKSRNKQARQEAGYVLTTRFGGGVMPVSEGQYVYGFRNIDALYGALGMYTRGNLRYKPNGLITRLGTANGSNAGKAVFGAASRSGSLYKAISAEIKNQKVESASEVNEKVQLKQKIIKIYPRKENSRMVGRKNPQNSNETFLELEADLYHDTIKQDFDGTIDTTYGPFLGRRTFTHPNEVLGTHQE